MPADMHRNKPTESPSRPTRDASNHRHASVDMSLLSLVASGSLLVPSISRTPETTAATFLPLGFAGSHVPSRTPEEHRQYLLGVLNSALAIVRDIDDLRGEDEEQCTSRRANDRRNSHRPHEEEPQQ